MIASRATALLPVCRSPMISCRWPRPMAVMASMALMPVCSGSFTGWRCTTVGACSSSGAALRRSRSRRARRAGGRGRRRRGRGSRRRPARRGSRRCGGPRSPPRCAATSPRSTTADLADVEVQREAEDAALELEQLVGHGARQALDAGDAVTGLGDAADLFALRLGAKSWTYSRSASRISSGRMDSSVIRLLLPFSPLGHRPGGGYFVSMLLQCACLVSGTAGAGVCHVRRAPEMPLSSRPRSAAEETLGFGQPAHHAAVHDLVADLHDDPAQHVRNHIDPQLDLAAEGA